MLCPHCGTGINPEWNVLPFEYDKTDDIAYRNVHVISGAFCPECSNFIVRHQDGKQTYDNDYSYSHWEWAVIDVDEFIYPKFPVGKTLDNSIPRKYIDEYKEAERVLQVSPKSSATLCRRLLQNILQDKGIKKATLEKEIEEFSQQNNTPSELVETLTLLRKVGNFGAHPKKSTNTGEIVEVEQGEAELLLEAVDELFDFLFVRPTKRKAAIDAIKEKYNIEL